MNPYSSGMNVFQTQADQRFNSFSDPMNPVNMNGGAGWGIDPAYMTPSYMSPYRPQYQGPAPHPGGVGNPGFFNSANNIFNPLAGQGVNYGGQTYAQNQPFYDSVIHKPMDASMSVAQNLVVPGLFGIAAWKYLTKPAEAIGRGVGMGLGRGLFGTMMSAPALGTTMGAMGSVGALAAGMTLPYLALQGAVNVADKALFDPYIAQRQMGAGLRSNFAGVTFGDASGNLVTGGGFSRSGSAAQARQLSVMGAQDYTFNQTEVGQLTDYAARSGLLDNVNGGQIADRMKSIVKQVKTVMAVANTSDFREAIETISKLQMAGVSSAHMSGALGALSGYAGAAGKSVSQMMNTVGAQGQYLFQANGLTPYVGQLVAGQANASFEAAYRSGLISPAALARLGGKEGATQSSVAGQLAAAQSPLFGIMGYNAFLGRGSSNSLVGTMNSFGGSMASNPIESIGRFNLTRPGITSKMLEEGGLERVQDMLRMVSQNIPGAMGSNGRIKSEVAYEVMTKTMGLTDDQARSLLEQYRAAGDANSTNQISNGFNKAKTDTWLKTADQLGLNKGFATSYIQSINAVGRNVQASTSDWIGSMIGYGSSAGDSFENWYTKSMYGMSADKGAVSADRQSRYGQIRPNKGLSISAHSSSWEAINELAKKGDQDANAFMASSGITRQNLIVKMAREGKISSEYKSGEAAREFGNHMDKYMTTDYFNDSKDAAGLLTDAWSKVFTRQGFSGIEADEFISMTDDAAGLISNNKIGSKEWDSLRSKFSKKMGRDLNDADIQGYVDTAALNSEATGTYGRGQVWKMIQGAGFDSYEDLTSAIKSDGGYEKTLSKLLGRKVSAKDGRMSEAQLAVELSKKAGINVLERKRDYENIKNTDPGQLRAQHEAIRAISDKHAQFQRLRENGIIDFNTEQQAHAAIDMQASVSKFSDAVDRFDSKVPGGSAAPGNPWSLNDPGTTPRKSTR